MYIFFLAAVYIAAAVYTCVAAQGPQGAAVSIAAVVYTFEAVSIAAAVYRCTTVSMIVLRSYYDR